jgi:hypothetical protein
MKWFQHLTNASDDEDITALLEQFGPEGYGVYWLIGELVGRNIKDHQDDPSHSLLPATWARKCFISESKFTKIVNFLADRQKISLERKDKHLVITHEKIMKYCSDWVKRLQREAGETPETRRTDSGGTPAIKKERKKENKERKRDTPESLQSQEASGAPESVDRQQGKAALKAAREALDKLPTQAKPTAAVNEKTEPEEEERPPAPTIDELEDELDNTFSRILDANLLPPKAAEDVMELVVKHHTHKIDAEQFSSLLDRIVEDRRTKIALLGIPGVVTRVRA